MKKLTTLLTQRQALLRQTRLANLAFAYTTLSEFGRRIARGRLTGEVTLLPAAAEAERYWASLTALDGRQAVIEEHFADEDLMDLADVMAFLTGNEAFETTFRLEEMTETFLVPLRTELERHGVAVDAADSLRDAVRQEDVGSGGA